MLYNIKVDDSGSLPGSIVSDLEKCLTLSLESDPESPEELSQNLATSLRQTSGTVYKVASVNKVILVKMSSVPRSNINNFFIFNFRLM